MALFLSGHGRSETNFDDFVTFLVDIAPRVYDNKWKKNDSYDDEMIVACDTFPIRFMTKK